MDKESFELELPPLPVSLCSKEEITILKIDVFQNLQEAERLINEELGIEEKPKEIGSLKTSARIRSKNR